MFSKIMGIIYLVLSFTGYTISVYHLRLFEYTSVMSIVVWTVALVSATLGCWLIFRK